MSIVQGACTSFKEELLQAIHDFTSDTFKIALYSSSASLGPNTTVYTAVAEISGTGYTSTGKALTISQVPVSAGGIAYVSFSDVSWESSTITARGALIYNSSKSNKAVAVLDFGSNKTTSGSTFTVTFPAPNQTSAIFRIS